MSEMVDRVARALCHAECPAGCKVEKCLEFTSWLAEARAAIAAMREPTEAMLGAALDSMEDQQAATESILPAEVWRTMIDAALAEG